jgi:NAD(P)-dependent dehydrogenase (short-subunit alcohol dehydrogenase family)
MDDFPYKTALIVGAGPGISASLTRRLAALGVRVGLAARNVRKLDDLVKKTSAKAFASNAGDAASIAKLFDDAGVALGEPDLVIFNAQARVRGPLTELDAEEVASAVLIGAVGGFFVVQQAARRMLPRRHGAILLTEATATINGYAQSAPFAMSKFTLRALAQRAARELGPQGIHVAHFVIGGVARSDLHPDPPGNSNSTLDPGAIAQTYVDVLRQPRSAWSLEVEHRPWVERF